MMSNLRITLTITNLRVFFKSSLIAKIMRSFKLIIAQLLKPEVLQYGTSGLSFQIVRLLSNQTGFVSGWHSLPESFLPNLFLVHHVWRTAITKNKDTASNGCIFIVLRGMLIYFT